MPDARLLHSSVAAFADAIGCPLTGWQVQALELESRITVIVAPRQSGKSRSLAVLALWWAFRKPGQRVLIVSAGEEASRRLLAEVRRLAASSILAGSVVDEMAGLVTLTNGSEVRSVPASERQVRGWQVDLLLVDEAALVSDDLLQGAALPTTSARPDARVVLASSPTTAAGSFYDHAVRGEGGSEHVRTFRWSLAEAEWIAPSVIAAARESMTSARFAAEFEGVFSSGADSLFSRATLERVIADYVPQTLGTLEGPARLMAGVDWGLVHDMSALVAIGRLGGYDDRRFGVACAHRWLPGVPLPRVVADIAASPGHFHAVTMEMNGLGGPSSQMLTDALRRRERTAGGGDVLNRSVVLPAEDVDVYLARAQRQRAASQAFVTKKVQVHTTADMKAASYSALRMLVDQERLLVPAGAEDLIRELLMLRVDLTPGGVERIEAGSGHDDLADALMLATLPHRVKSTGRWRCYLADLTDPRSRLPKGMVPTAVDHLPTVRTAGGVEVPRVPVWQSVAGSEITLPAGVDLKPRPWVDPRMVSMRAAVQNVLNPQPKEQDAR